MNDRKRELAVFSITVLVHCLGASFALACQKIKKRHDPAQKNIKVVSRKTAHNNLYDPVKTSLIISIY